MRLVLTLLIALAVLLVAAVFGAVNDAPVTVNYLLGIAELRLAYALLCAFGVGLLFGGLLASAALLRQRIGLKRTHSELAVKTRELNELRTLPVRDSR